MPFVNGKAPWNKGKKGLQVAWNKGLTRTDPSVEKYASQLEGHKNFKVEFKGCFEKGLTPWNKGTGTDRYWNRREYRELRTRIYERENYTCQGCYVRGGKLTMHHIYPIALFPDQFADDDNVVVFCVACHRLTDTWGLRLVRHRGEFKESLSQTTLSQAREETLLKVQRLAAEAKANAMPVIAATSAPLEREEIV